MSCKDKISERCTKKVNAVCVKYEGTLSSNTALDVEDCHDLEEVIEDINGQLDNINESIDLSGLGGSCIEYSPAGESLLVGEALLTLETKICELIEFTGVDAEAPCPTCEDPCEDETTCNNGLTYYNYATGAISATSVGTWITGATPSDMYSSNLIHSIANDGKYKFTVELSATLAGASIGKVGISVNTVDPVEGATLVGFFSSALVEGNTNNKTFSFVKDLKKTDSVRVMFKLDSGTSFDIASTKVIIEKVGK
jgi:hypothetical protein